MFRGRVTSCALVKRQTSCVGVSAVTAATSVCAVSNFSSGFVQKQQQNNFSSSSSSLLTVSAMPKMSLRFLDGPAKEPEGTKRSGAYLLDKADVLARVNEVVKNFEKVDASKVTPESHFINDLGLDSLDVVEVVMALEQEFVLDIPDHEAEKIQSIPDAVDYLSANPMAK